MSTIQNPVLRGFNPDPGLLRVGEDYYIVTSTFEWFPGIMLYHSRDLAHWELLARPLCRKNKLDLGGVASSLGVWAPDLSYEDGIYYLVYTLVRATEASHYDTLNYLVTAKNPRGPWSMPVALNACGFDPSLYHENDRHYLVSMMIDSQPNHQKFGGIILQEYDAAAKVMRGPIQKIFYKKGYLTEGPHLYRRGGWYYLLLAVGGTGKSHSEWVCRAKSLLGPYEEYPGNPILIAKGHPESPLKKTGHLSLCDTPAGDWYGAFLCARPIDPEPPEAMRCPLGRETAIEAITWTSDGWPVLKNGRVTADLTVETALPDHPYKALPSREHFNGNHLPAVFASSRLPLTARNYSLIERPGWLRLYGRQSLGSKYEQSLLARRWQSVEFSAATLLEFQPACFQQAAGLVCFYNTENYYYLHMTWDEDNACPCLRVLRCLNRTADYPVACILLPRTSRVELQVTVSRAALDFAYRTRERDAWLPAGPTLDASDLSDEACEGLMYTGSFVGIACQDATGLGAYADFDWFEYKEKE